MDFNLKSDFAPMGDQPDAIRQLVDGVKRGQRAQVLQGVTGSGKTFTVANVIQTTTTSRRLTLLPPIPILRKTCKSMTNSTNYDSVPAVRC